MIIMTWLITIATAQAQSGLNVSPLFEGKNHPHPEDGRNKSKRQDALKVSAYLFQKCAIQG